MKTKIIAAAIVVALGAMGVAQVVGLPQAKVTIHVLGEDGQPIGDANTTLGFCSQFNFETNVNVTGPTDANGNFTGEGHSNGVVGNEIHKDGYYMGWAPLPTFYKSKDGEWQPWDQTYTTVLRKVGTRIPMYVRKFGAKIPGAVNEPCGFDLEEADWVAPYGKGKVADFIFTTTNAQYRSDNDYEANTTISFSNNGDGIQEVELPKEFANGVFKWPREAPEDGYQANLEAHRLWHNVRGGTTGIDTSKDHQAYFFRVRTIKQNNRIVSALYGKITGGFRTGTDAAGQHGYIEFTYYLNPTALDQNLEFSGESLFKNLPQDETAHEP